MEWMTFVKKENVMKAEEALRSDFDTAAKQSITIREAGVLGIDMSGSFFLISGTDSGVAKCKELIKGFAVDVEADVLAKVKEEIRKEEDAAAEGMGSIFG